MQVSWKARDLNDGLGHGVLFSLFNEDPGWTLGFIEGYGWLNNPEKEVVVWLDNRLSELPSSIRSELRLAMLLFLTDSKRQKDGGIIHGFNVHMNA